jgi:hypothetical protein
MLKKIVFLVALTLSVTSAIHVGAKEGPLPDCYPCDGSGN